MELAAILSDQAIANARNFERFDEAADAIDYWNNNANIGKGEACWRIDGGRYHNIVEWLYAPMYTGKKKEEKEEGDTK